MDEKQLMRKLMEMIASSESAVEELNRVQEVLLPQMQSLEKRVEALEARSHGHAGMDTGGKWQS